MKKNVVVVAAVGLLLCVGSVVALGQQTPKSSVATYESLADAILAVKRTESNFVRTMLIEHRESARQAMRADDLKGCAAEMALFANEGDNAIGGVRKRLLEGGHHHNAAGEAEGIYEPGYVIVTIKAKKEALAAAADMQMASDDEARKAAWQRFKAAADPLVKSD